MSAFRLCIFFQAVMSSIVPSGMTTIEVFFFPRGDGEAHHMCLLVMVRQCKCGGGRGGVKMH